MNINTEPRFTDRREAGQILATHLEDYANQDDVLVLGLPRGGVPVAFEVALALHLPLDVFIVRKLGLPGQEELAMGAIASGGVQVLNTNVIRYAHVTQDELDYVVAQERQELKRRERAYRENRPAPQIRGRTIILVDDGLATGASMIAAINALRELEPARIVVAVPTAPPETCDAIRDQVDEVICAITPESFRGVARWYRDFPQTTDEEVRNLLQQAESRFL